MTTCEACSASFEDDEPLIVIDEAGMSTMTLCSWGCVARAAETRSLYCWEHNDFAHLARRFRGIVEGLA